MQMRRTGAVFAVTAMAVGLAACGGGGSYTNVVDKLKGAKEITVGTKWDQPSLGLKKGGGDPEGFDVDVAKYIVKELAGGQDVKITWKESPSSNREALLANGTVDIIFATYSITDARKPKVTFGGPYVVVHQDTMVRADAADINKATDLKDKRICQAQGSNSYKRITDPPPDGKLNLPAKLVGASNYSECVQKLSGGNLDAVTTDNLILAGFASQDPGKYKLLNDPFTDEKYGIGLKKGDKTTCEAVNKAVAKMWQDGTATQLLTKWFGKTGLDLPKEAPPAEGCA
ncbi:glutamate ABC transporter substrate-binding protein [Nonomuraea aurantiaca]|jgi:glutamate transport system substrate-binding protein|uniref:glutamate ABC transporter substrate-binding protein n=1 Tax=Nonomuraea aurantiaca TaxID=2878562 RepID=UPI001CD91FFC|nr:glutamate ABC transporter substrate-binding protein [Nonomuraea aurantiaca]MCA2221554.1 glutamate ABC transporter substrate-binding protein [Nonomuraea aurantiaca]